MSLVKPPKIDERDFEQLFEKIQKLAKFYVPDWQPISEEKDEKGTAISKIFCEQLKGTIDRLNKVPEKNFIEFLNSLLVKQIPPQSAEVPVQFTVSSAVENGIIVSEKSLLSAPANSEHEELFFETKENLLVAKSKLERFFSFNSSDDHIYNYTEKIKNKKPISLFYNPRETNHQNHTVYIGHSNLLKLKNPANITITFETSSAQDRERMLDLFKNKVIWEYNWKEAKASNLEILDVLTPASGNFFSIVLQKTDKQEIKEEQVNGISNFWIRARLDPNYSTDLAKIAPTNKILIKVFPYGEIEEEQYHKPDLMVNNNTEIKSHERSEFMKVNGKEDWENKLLLKDKNLIISEEGLTLTNLIGNPISRNYISKALESRNSKLDWQKIKIISKNPVNTSISLEYRASNKPEIASIPDSRLKWIKINTDNSLRNQKEHQGKFFQLKVTIISDDGKKSPVLKGILLYKKLKPFFPFGKTPRTLDSFYIASEEILSKKNSKINLKISRASFSSSIIDSVDTRLLTWEYWNGKGWKKIQDVKLSDKNESNDNPMDEQFSFTCPSDIEETSIIGQKNYWIRVRIASGDYGKEQYKVIVEENSATEISYNINYDSIKAPKLLSLKMKYSSTAQNSSGREPENYMSLNNLEYSNDFGKSPFRKFHTENFSIFLGFDEKIEGGPFSIFFDLKETIDENLHTKTVFSYFSKDGDWKPLEISDGTQGFTHSGYIKFNIPKDFIQSKQFGETFFWFMGEVKNLRPELQNFSQRIPELRALYPNSVSCDHSKTIKREILGSSDGRQDQIFPLQKIPILNNQIKLWVNEINTISDDEISKLSDSGKIQIKKGIDEKNSEVWVQWDEFNDFSRSDKESRIFTVDKVGKEIKFSDGISGKIPSIGKDNIFVNYSSGGGFQGNVGQNEITTPVTAIPFLDKIKNPIPAFSGQNQQSLESVMESSPKMIRHRNQAVTTEDFEWLVRSHFPSIEKIRCLGGVTPSGKRQGGWVTLVAVPTGKAKNPKPSLSILQDLESFFQTTGSNVLEEDKKIKAIGPNYVAVSLNVGVFTKKIENASLVEKKITNNLEKFLHPTTGGFGGLGWNFGEVPCHSDFFGLIEKIPEVDYIDELRINLNDDSNHVLESGVRFDDNKTLRIAENSLIYNGIHKISVKIGGKS